MKDNTPDSGTEAATPEQNKLSSIISATPPNAPPQIGERYELQGVIAKGGMGVVHKGWDHVLKRPVAVKLLHDHVAAPLVIKRFDYEAHITGQLQHPSIPPVHDLGTTAHGKPFLVMKLIKGRTLDDLIKHPGDEKLNVLGIFESIAQAIGYAHSHAVIHRDLKPLNVMVGAFGEVQVMDWGLAKFRSDAEATTPEASIASTFYDPRPADEDSKTSAGAILGTPAYMPPEQAIGAIDQVNERSDVFGLGGILCAMLTGKPPFVGVDGESTRKLSAQGKVQDAFARLDASGAEPEVIALAKRCLAVEPAERPSNGYEVARSVAKLRHDADERAKQAEIGIARSETRRRVLTWSAAAVFAVISAGAAVSMVQAKRAWDAEQATGQQLVLTQGAEKAVGEQLVLTQAEQKRALTAEAAAKAKTKEVETTLAVVGQRTKLALDAYNEMVFEIQEKLEDRADTRELRKVLLEKARSGLAKILNDARRQGTPDRTIVWSYFQTGDISLELGNPTGAKSEYRAGLDIALSIAEAAPRNAEALSDLSNGYYKLGDATLQIGRASDALDLYKKGLAIDRELAEDSKNEHARRQISAGYDRIGNVSLKLGQTPDALRAYREGFAIRKKKADDDPKNRSALNELAISYDKLGNVTFQIGQPEVARDYYQKGLEIRGRLAEIDPKHHGLKRKLSISYERLGLVEYQLGRPKDALDYYRKGLAVRRALAAVDPTNAQYRRDLSVCYNKLGDASMDLNRPSDALDYYREGLTYSQSVALADPASIAAQRDLGISYEKVGDATLQLNRAEDALENYRKSLTVRRQLVKDDPGNVEYQRELGIINVSLGDAKFQLVNSKGALEFYREALEIHRLLADRDPTNGLLKRDLLVGYYKIGSVSERDGAFADAAVWYEKALEVAAKFERPAFFESEVQLLKNQIGKCKAKLNPMNGREVAPSPREK